MKNHNRSPAWSANSRCACKSDYIRLSRDSMTTSLDGDQRYTLQAHSLAVYSMLTPKANLSRNSNRRGGAASKRRSFRRSFKFRASAHLITRLRVTRSTTRMCKPRERRLALAMRFLLYEFHDSYKARLSITEDRQFWKHHARFPKTLLGVYI